jgi:PhnB protein
MFAYRGDFAFVQYPRFRARLDSVNPSPVTVRRVRPAREKSTIEEAMATKPRSVPAGKHSATPYLIVQDAARAITFYIGAFGAAELMRLTTPQGKIVHAEVQIGDSPIIVADEVPEWGNRSPMSSPGSSSYVHLYVEDVDAVVDRAVTLGAKLLVPVGDQFYGDRSGRLLDPFGYIWIVATHTEDVSLEELNRRFNLFLSQGHQG